MKKSSVEITTQKVSLNIEIPEKYLKQLKEEM